MIIRERPAWVRGGGRRLTLLSAAVALTVLLLAACDAGTDTIEDDGSAPAAATTGEESTAPEAPEGSSGGDPILDFYQCLRDNGLDVADPAQGSAAIGLPGLDMDDPATSATVEECGQEHLSASDGRVTVGDGQMGDNLAEPDALIAFVDCLRDQGIDMPDPSPDGRLTMPQNVDPQDSDFQNAGQQCSEHLDGGGILMGDGGGGGTVGQRS